MPDVILENARIWSKDSKQLAESAVIADGRFVFVGKRSDAPRRPGAKIIDARGRVVLPGLIDSHIHMLGGGRLLSSLFLGEVKNKNEFIEKIRQHARTLPQTAWVTAWGWSVESWQNPQQPVKEWIDECTGNRPAFLQRMDFHSVLVNSAALKSAGITRHGPPDPPGGKIERHPRTGEPTGILREAAVNLVQRLLPRPTLTDQFNALKTAIDEALKHGITTVADIPFIKELPAYEKLAQDNPRVRFFLYPIARDWASAAKQINSFRGKQGFVSAK
ncbi:MAG TPA: hypothetical protein ENJ06_02750, partial [Phycisphaeraceae bacterium]|nr:hypothetical protein [Phycisphaeraceae bacterium]